MNMTKKIDVEIVERYAKLSIEEKSQRIT